MALERLWAGWRSDYLAAEDDAEDDAERGAEDDAEDATEDEQAGERRCPFCRILRSGEADDDTYVVWRGVRCFAVLNAYPYASGHVLVMPYRHVGELPALAAEESSELWEAAQAAVVAVTAAYRPDGVNLGANLGRAAGAGVPGHLHLHVVPRWAGDSNFMTSVAEARVLPEALATTYRRVRGSWPGPVAIGP